MPATPDTLFNLSASKSVTAMLLRGLAERRLVDLDEQVRGPLGSRDFTYGVAEGRLGEVAEEILTGPTAPRCWAASSNAAWAWTCEG